MKTVTNTTQEGSEEQVDWAKRVGDVKEMRYQLIFEVMSMARHLLAGCMAMPPDSVRLSEVIKLVGMANQLGADMMAMQPENKENNRWFKEMEEALDRVYGKPLPGEEEAEAVKAVEAPQASPSEPKPEIVEKPMPQAEEIMPAAPSPTGDQPSATGDQPSATSFSSDIESDPPAINNQPSTSQPSQDSNPSTINPQPSTNTRPKKKPPYGTLARQEWARRKFGYRTF